MQPSVEYIVRRSKRARHILLHVELDGSIEVVVPWRVAVRDAEAFVRQRQVWIGQAARKQRQKHAETSPRALAAGSTLPAFGRAYVLEIEVNSGRRRTSFTEKDGRLQVRVNHHRQIRAVVVRWYKEKARDYIETQADAMADRIGVWIEKISIGDFKTQWGSCQKRARTLAFSWRLALGPEAAAHYVIAHEVAHLKHANHSAQFWQTVAQLEPEFAKARAWLKRWGHTLVL